MASTIVQFHPFRYALGDPWQPSALLRSLVFTDFTGIIAKIAEIARKTISFISPAFWFPTQVFYEKLGNLGNESLQTYAAAGFVELPKILLPSFWGNLWQFCFKHTIETTGLTSGLQCPFRGLIPVDPSRSTKNI